MNPWMYGRILFALIFSYGLAGFAGTSCSQLVQEKSQHKIARSLALKAHGDQRYGEHPYSYHLHAVRAVLKRFGFGPKDSAQGRRLGTAAWLHDILEDTQVTKDELIRVAGAEIAEIVIAVSNLSDKSLTPREQKIATLRKIAQNPDAIILKLADRIANTEESLRNNRLGKETRIQKYIEEWPMFQAHLRPTGLAPAMWQHLEFLYSNSANNTRATPTLN